MLLLITIVHTGSSRKAAVEQLEFEEKALMDTENLELEPG